MAPTEVQALAGAVAFDAAKPQAAPLAQALRGEGGVRLGW